MNLNKNQEIKISNFPLTKIYILLNKYISEKIVESSKIALNISKNYDLSVWLNKQSLKYGLNTKYNGGDIDNFKSGKKLDIRTNKIHLRTMPVWVILELAKLSKISINEIHKNISGYRSDGSGNLIYKPKLPIKITPEFESIIFHIFGDGSAGKGTPSFAQKKCIS